MGLPACEGPAEDTEGIAGRDAAGSRCPAAQKAMLDSEKQTVRA
jgi:hypothetical protein